jgi:hypothetical protein
MVTAADFTWGSYREWEGPVFFGKLKYKTPINPDFLDKCLSVLAATEGNAYDAVNMYDRCILSVGLIQWCEAGQYSVSSLLGRCLELDTFLFEALLKKFPAEGITFKKNPAGQYRFYMKGQEVNTLPLQRTLLLGGPEIGAKGTWTPEAKEYAKKVGAWFADIWEVPLFRTIQAEFTKVRIPRFTMPQSEKILFQDKTAAANEGWSGALRAMFYSFAGNLPAVANKSMMAAAASPTWDAATPEEKFCLAAQVLTFGPGIAIYPHRYDKIAPAITRLFGVAVPTDHKELRSWEPTEEAPPPVVTLTPEEFEEVAKINKMFWNISSQPYGMAAMDELMKKKCD